MITLNDDKSPFGVSDHIKRLLLYLWNCLLFPHLPFTIESSHLFTDCKSVLYKSFHFFVEFLWKWQNPKLDFKRSAKWERLIVRKRMKSLATMNGYYYMWKKGFQTLRFFSLSIWMKQKRTLPYNPFSKCRVVHKWRHSLSKWFCRSKPQKVHFCKYMRLSKL